MPRRNRWRLPEPALTAKPDPDPALRVLQDLAHALLRASRPEEAMQFALDRACPVVGASLGSVFVVDGASELMRLEAAYGWHERWRPWLGEMRVRLGVGPSGEAASERRVIEVPDVFADPGLEDWQEVARELGFRALVALPLVAPDSILGAATFYFASAGERPSGDRVLLGAVADLMAAMADREALRGRLRRAEAALEDQRSSAEPRTEEEHAGGDNEATDA